MAEMYSLIIQVQRSVMEIFDKLKVFEERIINIEDILGIQPPQNQQGNHHNGLRNHSNHQNHSDNSGY